MRRFQLKPEVWKLSLNAMRQKVDGLMDITAREAGSFYTPGRTTLIPAGTGGAQDIGDWDDTTLTTVTAQLDYAVAKAWTLSAGYLYEKYDFKDAYTAGDLLMPQSVLLFLKSNRRSVRRQRALRQGELPVLDIRLGAAVADSASRERARWIRTPAGLLVVRGREGPAQAAASVGGEASVESTHRGDPVILAD